VTCAAFHFVPIARSSDNKPGQGTFTHEVHPVKVASGNNSSKHIYSAIPVSFLRKILTVGRSLEHIRLVEAGSRSQKLGVCC